MANITKLDLRLIGNLLSVEFTDIIHVNLLCNKVLRTLKFCEPL
jgi:hypothetical protein